MQALRRCSHVLKLIPTTRTYLTNPKTLEKRKPDDLCYKTTIPSPKIPFDKITVEDAKKILTNLTPEEEKQLKILKLEYDVFFSTGVRVPNEMTSEMWCTILKKPSVASRRRMYNFWFKTEKKIENEKKRKQKKALQPKPEKSFNFYNNIYFFVRETTMNQHYYNNLCHAMRFGPPLLFDMSFENKMTDREVKNFVTQLQYSHSINKMNQEPFHFSFYNVLSEGRFFNQMHFFGKDLSNIPWTVSNNDFQDIYDKENLIYLSPNGARTMKEYDHNAIYIIGGIVDRSEEVPLTFAKAKKEKIRSVRFPLERYLDWTRGSKSLTIDQVVGILLRIKQNNNNWEAAFSEFVPKRKTYKD
ncbi:unnamed protein product [Dimorphilus gyrociliatus]|uniref:RNA (guanine-9-)-methyltransferase domain-containing protein 1 n=1 Tax=Dimorphilus gyrociliatus TaxID=2664684 RepID=A0A7I8V8Q3_9ANNE|nr:unnamed protein product [Dimorphilus gyrociliatus]